MCSCIVKRLLTFANSDLLRNLHGTPHAIIRWAAHWEGGFAELLLEFLTLFHNLSKGIGVAKDHHLGVGRFAGELTTLRQLLLHPSLDTTLMFEDSLVWDGTAGACNGNKIVVRAGPLKVPLEDFLPLLGMDGNWVGTARIIVNMNGIAQIGRKSAGGTLFLAVGWPGTRK